MKIWLSTFGPTTHGESGRAVAAGVRKSGANALLVFTSLYHGYRLIQRRYPQKAVYSLECDRAFWKPDPSLYKDCGIVPQRSLDFADGDWLKDISSACRAEGVTFSALIPICAGERLVQDRPDIAVTNLYGSKDRLFMCYNHPQVQAYRLAMVEDIVGRYPLDALMLDKIPQIQLEQRSFSGLFDPPLRTVGSFCFCEHCRKAAKAAGLDLDEVRERSLEIARRSLAIPPYIIEKLGDQLTGDTEIPLLLLEEPLLRRMLEFRFNSMLDFIGRLRKKAKALKPGLVFQSAYVPPMHIGHDMTSPRAWLAVQSYKLCREAFDEIFCVVHWDEDIVRFETARAVSAAEGRCKVTTSMRLYGATRPEQVAGLAEAALAAGSADLSFLGYDVTTNELLAALAAWGKARKASRKPRPAKC